MPYAKPYVERPERAKDIHRERVREWKRRNRDKVRAQKRRWNLRKKGLEPRFTNEEYIRQTFGPELTKAEKLKRYRTWKKARKVSVECCEICGSNDKLERHHTDYSEPLDVRVLCGSCHRKLHHKTISGISSPKCPETPLG